MEKGKFGQKKLYQFVRLAEMIKQFSWENKLEFAVSDFVKEVKFGKPLTPAYLETMVLSCENIWFWCCEKTKNEDWSNELKELFVKELFEFM